MKLIELKQLKEDKIYKKILNELKVKGLDKVYIQRTESIDYLDIIISVIDFLEKNKNILKKIDKNQFENIVIIIIDEIFNEMNINMNEEQIEKIIKLLKNSLLVQNISNYIYNKFKIFYSNTKKYFKNKSYICCSKKK